MDNEFLLDDAGQRIATDALPTAEGLTLVSGADAVDRALTKAGFVFMASVGPDLLVKLLPETVAPLAALAAAFEIEDSAPERVILAQPAPFWVRFKLVSPTAVALENLRLIARSASRRAALRVYERSVARSASCGRPPGDTDAQRAMADVVA